MNTALVNTTARQIRNSADYLTALGCLIETATHSQEIVPLADRIEVEIERLRVSVLLLRHDAQASRYPLAVDSPTQEGSR